MADPPHCITTWGEVHEILSIKTYDISPAHPSGILVASETRSGYDDLRRSYTATYLDGTTEPFNYACCGLSSITDRSGAITEYDWAGRRTRLGVSLWTNSAWTVTLSNKFAYSRPVPA